MIIEEKTCEPRKLDPAETYKVANREKYTPAKKSRFTVSCYTVYQCFILLRLVYKKNSRFSVFCT